MNVAHPTRANVRTDKLTHVIELQCVVVGRNSIGSGKWHGDKCLRLLYQWNLEW